MLLYIYEKYIYKCIDILILVYLYSQQYKIIVFGIYKTYEQNKYFD